MPSPDQQTTVDNKRILEAMVQKGQELRLGNVSFILTADLDLIEVETNIPELIASNQQVSKPVPEFLTKAQKKIFDLMVVGMATKTIAKRLKLSPHTVHDQIRKILHAYGVHSRVELMAILINSKVPGVDRNE